MSCQCENKRLGQEYERIRGLAKGWAKLENKLVALYRNEDGTYGFATASDEITKPIIEYITPY